MAEEKYVRPTWDEYFMEVAKTIAKLQSVGILRRVGPDKGGHWEIIPTDR